MKPESLQVLFVFLVQVLRFFISSAQQCTPSMNSEYGHALLFSAYSELPDEDLGSCYFKCSQDNHCSSINYNLLHGSCEHNYLTKRSVPTRFVRKDNSVYADKEEKAAHSCLHLWMIIKQKGQNPTDGIYRIYPNGGSNPPIMAYCDMSRDGGGWTLLVTSKTNTWTNNTVLLRNAGSPSVTTDYSILKHADDIKNHVNVTGDKFEYRLDAYQRGHWGGIWEAPRSYTFTARNNTQTNVSLFKTFDNWVYHERSIEKRMPWVYEERLTTSRNATYYWWGTITAADGQYHPAPWIYGNAGIAINPGIIWYWMREGPLHKP